jgi:hypothetical protein
MSARRPLALVLTAAAEHIPVSARRNGHAESKIKRVGVLFTNSSE